MVGCATERLGSCSLKLPGSVDHQEASLPYGAVCLPKATWLLLLLRLVPFRSRSKISLKKKKKLLWEARVIEKTSFVFLSLGKTELRIIGIIAVAPL